MDFFHQLWNSEDLKFKARQCRRCKESKCGPECLLHQKAYSKYVDGVRREKKLGRIIEMTFDEFLVWAKQHLNDPCGQCAGTGGTLDHVIPLSRDGRHALDNLQMLCVSCNARKFNWLKGETRDYSHLRAQLKTQHL